MLANHDGKEAEDVLGHSDSCGRLGILKKPTGWLQNCIGAAR